MGGVVDCGSVEEHGHAAELYVAPDCPLLPEGGGDAVVDEEVGSPDGDGTEVVEDGVPHTVEHEGHEHGECVVEEDGEEVEEEHLAKLGGVLHHSKCVVRVLHCSSNVTSGEGVADGVKDEDAHDSSPESLHADEEEGGGGDLHGHDLRAGRGAKQRVGGG